MENIVMKGISLDIVWKNKQQNFNNIEKKYQSMDKADILILPEMFATGFCMNAEEIADRNEETLSWLRSFAMKNECAVCGSAVVAEGGKFYNRMYFVTPHGNYKKYDKRHLFSYSGEDKVYEAGKERCIVEFRGVRLLLQVCYDIRFPVFSRYQDDYEAIIYIANFPEKRIAAWEHLLKARAIENLSYVVGINRTGKDGNGLNYSESSWAFFADGSSEGVKQKNELSVEIDLQKLKKFREHFGFLNDADSFEINY